MVRKIGAWLLATLTTYVSGCIFMTQVVLARVSNLGIDVGLAARLRTTLADLAGLATSYLPLIAIAMAIAISVAVILAKFLPGLGRALLLSATTLAPGVLVGIMTLAFGLNPLAGATGVAGYGLQMLAGLLGGLVLLVVAPTVGESGRSAG